MFAADGGALPVGAGRRRQQVDPIAPLPPASATGPAAKPATDRRRCPTAPPPAGSRAALSAAAAAAVAASMPAQALLDYIRGIGREGLVPPDYDPAGLIAAMRSGDPMALVAGGDRPVQQAVVGPGAWPCPRRCADRLARRRQGPRRRPPAPAARGGAGDQPHPRGAQRPAADPSAIWRAEARAGGHAQDRDRTRSTRSGSTWTAGAGCRATLAQKYIIVNVPAFYATLVENGVTRWKHRAVAGAIKTPTPQLIGHGDRRDPQPLVGSADRASRRKSRASRAMSRSRARTARSSAGASRRGRPTRSAS